jgi:hypothetical protein
MVRARDFLEGMSDRRASEIEGCLPPCIHARPDIVQPFDPAVVQADGNQTAFGICESDERLGQLASADGGALSIEPLILSASRYEFDNLLVWQEPKLLEGNVFLGHPWGSLAQALKFLELFASLAGGADEGMKTLEIRLYVTLGNAKKVRRFKAFFEG